MNFEEIINKLTEKINKKNKKNLSPIQKMLLVDTEQRKRNERTMEALRIIKGESIALRAARGIENRKSQNAKRKSDEDIER